VNLNRFSRQTVGPMDQLVSSYRGWLTHVTQRTAISFPFLKFHYTFQHLQTESRKAWNLPNLIYGTRVREDITPRLDHIQNVPPCQGDIKTHSVPDDSRQLPKFVGIDLGRYRMHGDSGPIR